MPSQDRVEVYVASDVIEVSVVTGILEAAGVESWVRDMAITPYPVSVGPLGEKRIVVSRAQEKEARCVLQRAVEDGILSGEGIRKPETGS